MLQNQKELFGIPDGVHYLNCAYMSPLAEPVVEAGQKGLLRKTRPWEVTPQDFFDEVEALKTAFAALLQPGASPVPSNRIAILPSVSYGFATVMKNVEPQAGRKIVTVDEVFPSSYYTWKRLADDHGMAVQVVKAPDSSGSRAQAWNQAILEAIDEKTAVVSLPHIHWANGTRFMLEEIAAKARSVGAWLVVDGTQSVGVLPFDMKAIQPDALICAGYKWLLGPYGMSLAWFGPRLDGGRPLEENWMHREGSENFAGLVNYQDQYKPGAARYSMGETSSFIHIPMQLAAVRLLAGWGIENIQDYCSRLSSPFAAQLETMGCQLEAEAWRSAHILGVRLPESLDQEAFAEELKKRKVFVSYRGSYLRISCHLFNDEQDFEELLQAMGDCIG
ncbi:MAG: aminotransferase class V-fold PLP-dependent enzyme [Saprospiraceae bacterium]